MQQKIRKNMFETNSSSSHSITVSDQGLYKSITPDHKGTITITGGEFGWEFETHSDPWTKLNYLAIDIQHNESLVNTLVEMLKAHTGATNVVFDLGDSYIDHQSSGTCSDELTTAQQMKDFVFNTASVLETGNDNV